MPDLLKNSTSLIRKIKGSYASKTPSMILLEGLTKKNNQFTFLPIQLEPVFP